jgi:cell division protein FtsL
MAQDMTVQAMPTARTAGSARELVASTTTAMQLIPTWVILATIIVAATAVCCTVITRSQAEFRTSASQHQGMISQIDSLREANRTLQVEINHLTSDSNAIELAARQRLGMVRPNDVVVPIESISTSTSLGTLSFVR